jgi:hypothetical protein
MKHPGHTYGGFVPAISERGMTGGATDGAQESGANNSCLGGYPQIASVLCGLLSWDGPGLQIGCSAMASQNNGMCALCSQARETIEHLLLYCIYSREVWFGYLHTCYLSAVSSALGSNFRGRIQRWSSITSTPKLLAGELDDLENAALEAHVAITTTKRLCSDGDVGLWVGYTSTISTVSPKNTSG